MKNGQVPSLCSVRGLYSCGMLVGEPCTLTVLCSCDSLDWPASANSAVDRRHFPRSRCRTQLKCLLLPVPVVLGPTAHEAYSLHPANEKLARGSCHFIRATKFLTVALALKLCSKS